MKTFIDNTTIHAIKRAMDSYQKTSKHKIKPSRVIYPTLISQEDSVDIIVGYDQVNELPDQEDSLKIYLHTEPIHIIPSSSKITFPIRSEVPSRNLKMVVLVFPALEIDEATITVIAEQDTLHPSISIPFVVWPRYIISLITFLSSIGIIGVNSLGPLWLKLRSNCST